MFKKMINKIFAKFSQIKSVDQSPWEVYKKYLKVHPSVIIDPTASVKFFNPIMPPQICLEIGEGSHIFAHFGFLRPEAKIKIGKRCQLGNVNFVCAKNIEIGNDVIMAWGITILDSDHHSEYWEERQFDVEECRQDYLKTAGFDLGRSHNWDCVKKKKVTIGNKSWIGCNVIILKGVMIGEGTIIGAGSVVTHSIKPWHVAAGNPCHEIRKIKKSKGEHV